MEKDYSKYYTPMPVSSALTELIDFKDNCNVIDICCGSGNLLKAAKRQNSSICCYGVDINEQLSSQNYEITVCDGREYAVNNASKFDYALANPPFGHNYNKKYTEFIFENKYKKIANDRIEIEMLLANLMILNDNGTLLIIIPTTIIDGSSTINVRKTLALNHSIVAIIDLPHNAFSPEKIKCSALIINKSPSNNTDTIFYQMDETFKIEKKTTINASRILEGKWGQWDICQKTRDFVIRQGSISSNFFDINGKYPVLHTGRKSDVWQPTIRHTNLCPQDSYLKAEDGDIIISRIGASAGQKCVYHGTPICISDCLLIIKSPNKVLLKQLMEMDLIELVSGLSTPHITAHSIYSQYERNYLL